MRISDWSSDVCSSDLDRAAGGFVHPARLHADETVFDQIEPADAVLAAEIVERREQRGGRHRPAVQGNAVAPFEIDRDDLGLVGRVLGIDGARIDVIGHFLPRSEEHTSELQSLMRISYAVFCLKKKNHTYHHRPLNHDTE